MQIASESVERDVLEQRHGQVWDAAELQEEFEPVIIREPLIIVRRRDNNATGPIQMQAEPRYYFNFSGK
jgi:hypothetical protein